MRETETPNTTTRTQRESYNWLLSRLFGATPTPEEETTPHLRPSHAKLPVQQQYIPPHECRDCDHDLPVRTAHV